VKKQIIEPESEPSKKQRVKKQIIEEPVVEKIIKNSRIESRDIINQRKYFEGLLFKTLLPTIGSFTKAQRF
jgi:hypothetical protein